MKRTVEISTRIGDHLDLANLKFCTGSVVLFRLFAAQEVTDDWRRQTLVSNEAMLDGMAEIDELFRNHYRANYSAPMSHRRGMKSVPRAVATGVILSFRRQTGQWPDREGGRDR